MSHTVRVAVSYNDPDALGAAVLRMGGRVLGQGTHRLYEASETGFGFKLNGWSYPIVLTADGKLSFDDYGGSWGNVADLEALRGTYAVEAARIAAENQGWMTEHQADGSLLIYVAGGGTVTVTQGGTVEAQGFSGSGCQAPTEMIAAALGQATEAGHKPAWHQQAQGQQIIDPQ